MNNKSSFLKGLFAGLLIAVIITVVSFSIKIFVIDENKSDVSAIIDKAASIEKVIDEYYLEDSDLEELADAMYKGLVDGLGDQYSTYYTAEEYKSIMESVTGYYQGIGVSVLQNDDGETVILEVFENSPSQDVGIMPGDIIYKVEGENVIGVELSNIIAMIKGEAGTMVNVTVLREDEEISFDIERREIEIPSIRSEMLEDNIGYISIESFDTATSGQFREAVDNLTLEGMTSLIIDVRDNPGGTLGSVTDILDQILPEGLTIYTEDKNGNRDEYYSYEESKIELPMVVLTNENSASASEIFAGAMQDFGAATIVGQTTFGKGVMQSIRTFSDGSAIKITTAYFYTPDGNVINEIGIIPDVEVIIPEEAYEDYLITPEEDTQLDKAIEILK